MTQCKSGRTARPKGVVLKHFNREPQVEKHPFVDFLRSLLLVG
jgi:long-subunit acyl-CoA synthetase (AMP-forming)